MIPENNPHWQTQDWQNAVMQLITCPQALARHLDLPDDTWSVEATQGFPLKLPQTLLNRIKKGDPNDPVLKQFLPIIQEETQVPGFVEDPLQEQSVNPIPGLLHKFDNRVLLTLSKHCAVHCRYCFRRNFNYSDNAPGKTGWKNIYAHIAQNPTLEEVIFSGGDPLSIPDHYLAWHFQQLTSIKHVRVIRIHTRFPIVTPQRITPQFLEALGHSRQPLIMVMHINHAQEINEEVKQACGLLKQAGVQLFNQTVLLKGINDSVVALRDLSWALFDAGLIPYYLHCLDPVKGAAHFDLPMEQVKQLYLNLRDVLPGYLVPQLVKEIPGAKAKAII